MQSFSPYQRNVSFINLTSFLYSLREIKNVQSVNKYRFNIYFIIKNNYIGSFAFFNTACIDFCDFCGSFSNHFYRG